MSTSSETVSNTPPGAVPDPSSDTAPSTSSDTTPSTSSGTAAPGAPGRGTRLTLTGASLGRPGAPALDEVDLDIAPGEILTVVGPSGCGKSTLLRTLAGLLSPLAGEIAQDGHPLTGPSADRALVFQEDALLPWRTLRANVELPLAIRGVPRAERREQARPGWNGSDSARRHGSCRTGSPAGSASASSWPAPWPHAPAPS